MNEELKTLRAATAAASDVFMAAKLAEVEWIAQYAETHRLYPLGTRCTWHGRHLEVRGPVVGVSTGDAITIVYGLWAGNEPIDSITEANLSLSLNPSSQPIPQPQAITNHANH